MYNAGKGYQTFLLFKNYYVPIKKYKIQNVQSYIATSLENESLLFYTTAKLQIQSTTISVTHVES